MANFQMFTEEGNGFVTDKLQPIIDLIHSDTKVNKNMLDQRVQQLIKTCEEAGYDEVTDTEPAGDIQDVLNDALKKAGYGFELDRYDWS